MSRDTTFHMPTQSNLTEIIDSLRHIGEALVTLTQPGAQYSQTEVIRAVGKSLTKIAHAIEIVNKEFQYYQKK